MKMKLIHSATLMLCLAVVGCSSTGGNGGARSEVSQAWLDGQETALRSAMAAVVGRPGKVMKMP